MKRQWITTAICVVSLSVPGVSLAAQHSKPHKAKAHTQKNKGNASKQAKHANKGEHKGTGGAPRVTRCVSKGWTRIGMG